MGGVADSKHGVVALHKEVCVYVGGWRVRGRCVADRMQGVVALPKEVSVCVCVCGGGGHPAAAPKMWRWGGQG